eukprot:12291531-Heterocapsa_arctica.AAC.1
MTTSSRARRGRLRSARCPQAGAGTHTRLERPEARPAQATSAAATEEETTAPEAEEAPGPRTAPAAEE